MINAIGLFSWLNFDRSAIVVWRYYEQSMLTTEMSTFTDRSVATGLRSSQWEPLKWNSIFLLHKIDEYLANETCSFHQIYKLLTLKKIKFRNQKCLDHRKQFSISFYVYQKSRWYYDESQMVKCHLKQGFLICCTAIS